MNRSPVRKPQTPPVASPLFDRAPPFDPEAEIAVLGSMMLLPDVIDGVAPLLRVDDFHDDAHASIYDQMLAMHTAGRKIDPPLLVDKLKAAGKYESVGGAAYLGKILHAVPNAAHAVYYAEIVHKLAVRRRAIKEACDILRRAYDDTGDGTELVGEASSIFAALAADGETTQARLIGDIAIETVAKIKAGVEAPTKPGIMTGLAAIDQATGPMMPGELIVLAVCPGNGKTALAFQIAVHQAKRNRPPLFVSLEMRDEELVRRHLCQLAGLDSRDVRGGFASPDDIARLEQARDELQNLPKRIWSPPRATLARIRGMARRQKRNDGLELLTSDYLGLIEPTPDDRRLPRHEQVAGFTRELKALAKELEIPIVLLCQLNREAEDAPKLSHLRESGAIEQDADCVMFLFHPAKLGNKAPNDGPQREAHLLVAKHRHGEVGLVPLVWTPQLTLFESPAEF